MEDVLPPPAAELVEIDDDLETEAEGVKLLAGSWLAPGWLSAPGI